MRFWRGDKNALLEKTSQAEELTTSALSPSHHTLPWAALICCLVKEPNKQVWSWHLCLHKECFCNSSICDHCWLSLTHDSCDRHSHHQVPITSRISSLEITHGTLHIGPSRTLNSTNDKPCEGASTQQKQGAPKAMAHHTGGATAAC